MKQIILAMYWLMPLLSIAQENTGVDFYKTKSFQEILTKAKNEKKNIFIDAYATWCIPCKKMDADVYPNKEVADYINANFISVKIQMDQTKIDAKEIQQMYPDASQIMKTYKVDAFPTFLFLTPSGELIQKETGYRDVKQFLVIVKRSADNTQNYALQVKNFKSGSLLGSHLRSLALQAKEYHEDSLANIIALAYKKDVVDKNSPSTMLSQEQGKFLINFKQLFSLNDDLIKYINKNKKVADSSFNQKDLSQALINYFINKDIINVAIAPNDKYNTEITPDWIDLENNIAISYGKEISEKLILDAKIGWYSAKEDWSKMIQYTFERFDSAPLDLAGFSGLGINNFAYEVVFAHSNNVKDLNKAIGYMEILLKHNPEVDPQIDTYANLLYKVGRRKEAIIQEQKAIEIASARQDNKTVSEYRQILDKMRNNIPTWPQN